MTRPLWPLGAPAVYIACEDLPRLWALIAGADPLAARLLRVEIARAVVLRRGEPPLAYVRPGSTVEYADLLTGRRHRRRLVWPEDSGQGQEAVSVDTALGAALLGLRCGDAHAWTDETGRPRRLAVVGVMNPG